MAGWIFRRGRVCSTCTWKMAPVASSWGGTTGGVGDAFGCGAQGADAARLRSGPGSHCRHHRGRLPVAPPPRFERVRWVSQLPVDGVLVVTPGLQPPHPGGSVPALPGERSGLEGAADRVQRSVPDCRGHAAGNHWAYCATPGGCRGQRGRTNGGAGARDPIAGTGGLHGTERG